MTNTPCRVRLPFTLEQVYHQVNLIIPFRDIMLVEKQADNSNLAEIAIHSALMITTKDRVQVPLDTRSFSSFV